ncbi:unnamed protein product [Larinioides sclopetarius]|uniref:DRBM domain-containing protein n=2 Tax=Larinioides sclopetarius TaxID=280406 RepID=A0AAV1ZYR3_9ARAC
MCDSKKDITKESEANVTKTSPLIIRLCSETPTTSDPNVKSGLEMNTESLRSAKTKRNKSSNKSSRYLQNSKGINLSPLKKSRDVEEFIITNCPDVTKLNKSSISNLLEDQVAKPKRRKLGRDFEEALEWSHSSELPLVMQSSNLHSESGLDFGHDGGGVVTTDDSRMDVEQHSIHHDDGVPKSFNLKETVEKEESCNTIVPVELVSVKAEVKESNNTENFNFSEKPDCPENILKVGPLKHNRKKVQRNENSQAVKEAKNYESSDFTLNVISSTLSSDKDLQQNINQDRKTSVTPEISFMSKKDESFHNVDKVSTSQASSSHSFELDAEGTELKETVCDLQKRENAPNKSSQFGDAFSCPFKQFRKKRLETNNSSCQSVSLSSGDEMDNDSVCYLEISELEKMRESLKKQLSQDNDSVDLPAYSEKSQKAKSKIVNILVQKDSISDESNEQAVDDKSSSNYKPSNTNKMVENISEQRRECFVPKISDQHLIDTAERDLLLHCNPAEKSGILAANELMSVADTPPLVMQSSNLFLNDGLDNKHGGGGRETSVLKVDIKQEPSLDNDDSKDQDSITRNGGKATDNETFMNGKAVESDDSASNQAGNTSNDVQNGMMEFDILDEFESDDNEGDEENSDDSDISTDEIDAMLEEGLMQRRSVDGNNKEIEHEEKEKVILKVRGRDHFDVLPEGWIEVTHNSGMPIYLHKQSRVCSVSKPYFLGPGSTRKHEIPVSAIPCLHYLRELEKEKGQAEEKEKTEAGEKEKVEGEERETNGNSISDRVNENSNETKNSVALNGDEKKAGISDKNNVNPANGIFLAAKLETVKDTKESGSLDYLAVREYCKKRFEFQTITVKRFRTWSGRRKHQKQIKRKQRPFLPDNTKLITCPLLPSDKSSAAGNSTKREFIMNPSGKSPVCILHEYVQHTLRVQPKYIFKELESASTPYGAIVLIDNVEYGYGFGSSKKLAKSDAAKVALEILIPKMKMFSPDKNDSEGQNVDFFDQVRVEDPRVCELSVKAGQPYPYQILLECLKRNYGMGDTEIQFMMKNLKHQKNEFYMKVGKHEISVVCKNKRDGKHRASQAILQKLHPHINSWGSLLRMYGKGSHKTMKEKKEEEQRITELQSQACVNKPNMSILNKLKEEMLKYREKVKSMKPIGKLIPERMECFSTSSSNLKNVEL